MFLRAFVYNTEDIELIKKQLKIILHNSQFIRSHNIQKTANLDTINMRKRPSYNSKFTLIHGVSSI